MPKHVVAGVGEAGRSCVVVVQELTGLQADGRIGGTLASSRTCSSPEPRPPDDQRRDLRDLDLDVPTSGALWIAAWMAPDRPVVMHWTETVDFNTVVAGDVTLVLEEGEVHLAAGDTLLVPGVLHAWRPGPRGCMLSTVLVDAR